MPIRAATTDDLTMLLAHMRAFNAGEGYPWNEMQTRGLLTWFLADSRLGRIWVVESDGAVVGYVVLVLGFSFEFGGRDAFVDELYIASSHRGRGLGRLALETAIQGCREMGVATLHLEIEHGKDAVLDFYRRTGFVDHGRALMSLRFK